MTQLLTGFRYALAIACGLAVVLTLVSVVPSSVWWAQVLGFPRLQTLGVLALGLLGWLLLRWPAHSRVWCVFAPAAGRYAGAGPAATRRALQPHAAAAA